MANKNGSAASFQITAPDPFTFSPSDWPQWKRRFLRYRAASGLSDRPKECQVDALVYLMGPQAEDIFNTFKLTTDEQKNFDAVLKGFQDYFIPRRNIIYERAKFNTRVQLDGESVEDFATALHALADSCNYGELREELIRDRLVVGLKNHKLSQTLQLDPSLDLMKALTITRQNEAVQQQQAELLSGTPKEAVNLDALKVRRSRPAKDPVATQPPTTHHPRGFEKCGWCGKERHARAICPAKDCVCQKCGKKGHFQTVCRSANALRNIEQEPGLMATTASSKWEVSPLVESQTLVFQIDTGADETVIPEREFRRLSKHVVLTSPDRRLQGPDGKTLRISGLARLHFKLNGRESMEKVYILPGLRTALLGKPAITNLGLFPSVNNVSVPLPPYEQTRAELQRMCLETFSELIRERYLSPEEMSYIYGYNQPSKQDTEHRPPEYIADPILFRLSTPP
ncbi:uncharacterized protein LOC144168294 [Haemaphysalis longicornis]